MIRLPGFVGRNKDAIIAAALVFCTLVAGAMVMVPRVTGVFHDDGIYVSTARSLATGHGYRLINLPDAPPQTKYPPLYPALLAVVWRLWPAFPDNLLALHWLTLFMSAASVGLCYYYVSVYGYFRRPVAVIAGLLAASSNALLYYSSLLVSEMPFAFFLCAALLSLERYVRTPTNSLREKFVLTLLIALPFLTRSIGGVLIPVALLFLFLRRRFSWLIASGLALIVCAWFAWTLHARQSNPITYYYTSYWDWWRDYMSVRVLARVCLFNLTSAAYSIVFAGTALASRFMAFAPRLWPLAVPLAILAIPGLWQGLRRKQLLPWLLSFYLVIVLIWPWPPFRFIIPVLGFLLCYLIDGTWRLLRRLPPNAAKGPLIVAVSGLLVFANLWQTHAVGAFSRSVRYPTMATYWQSPAGWPSFLDAFTWIRTNTRPNDVIAGYFDSMIFLYTDRRAFRPLVIAPASPYYGITIPAVTPDQLFRSLQAYDGRYVLCTPFDHFGNEAPFKQMIEEIRRTHPGSIELAFVGKDRRFAIYRVLAPGRVSFR
jgi:4-amino-4-deoxy-L-arabinose transferase-like glycosyltransferase